MLEVFWINFETVLFLVGATKQTNYLTFGKTSNRFVFGGYNKTNQLFRDLGGWVEFLNSLSLSWLYWSFLKLGCLVIPVLLRI